jgi:hypothetical protein
VQQIASTKYFWDIYIRPLSSSLLSATLTLATCSIFPLASRKSISRVLPRHLRLPGRNLQVSPATNFTSTTENDPNHVDSLSVGPDPPPPPDIFGTMVPLHLRAPPPRSLASPPPHPAASPPLPDESEGVAVPSWPTAWRRGANDGADSVPTASPPPPPRQAQPPHRPYTSLPR